MSDAGTVPELPGSAKALLDAVIAISSDLDLHSVLSRIVVSATELTGAGFGALGIIGDDGELADFITTGIDPHERELIGELPRGRGILRLLIDEPEAIRLDDLGAHPASYGFPPHHPTMITFLGVPVRIRGTVFGNLYLTQKAAACPSPSPTRPWSWHWPARPGSSSTTPVPSVSASVVASGWRPPPSWSRRCGPRWTSTPRWG